MTLLICRTCPRDDRRSSGDFGRRLTAAIAALPTAGPPDVTVRGVLCLGGCLRHGAAAIDGAGKARIRFGDLTEHDAADLLAAAAAHEDCVSGEPAELDLAGNLRDRISAVTPKRGPQQPGVAPHATGRRH